MKFIRLKNCISYLGILLKAFLKDLKSLKYMQNIEKEPATLQALPLETFLV